MNFLSCPNSANANLSLLNIISVIADRMGYLLLIPPANFFDRKMSVLGLKL